MASVASRLVALSLPVLLAVACGDGGDPAAPSPGPGPDAGDAGVVPQPAKTSISGHVLELMQEVGGKRVAGAKISILEHPERSVTTGADATFQFDDLDVGSEITLVMEHPDYQPLMSATYTLGPNGIHPFTIQAISKQLFGLLSATFPPLELETTCILASTVTRWSGTLFARIRQGEEGATVSLAPAIAAESGPIYFNEQVIPDRAQKAVSKDGGVLYYKVPPGTYTLSAQKDGTSFVPVKLTCRAGFVTNGAPPIGLQANVSAAKVDWGATSADDAFTAATDAMCDATAKCVEATSPGNYPAATAAGCKQAWRRALAFVDPACDETSKMRETWKTFLACRAKDCTLTLGDDTSCAAEEEAYVKAMAAYAPCYSAK